MERDGTECPPAAIAQSAAPEAIAPFFKFYAHTELRSIFNF